MAVFGTMLSAAPGIGAQIWTAFNNLLPPPGSPIGRVQAGSTERFGTTEFGNAVHQRIADWLQAEYPGVQFEFRVRPGQTGMDVSVKGVAPGSTSPSWTQADIKPLTVSGERSFNAQVNRWNAGPVQAITYDAQGNIYLGFR